MQGNWVGRMICNICNKEFELKKENRYLVYKQDLSIIVNRNLLEAFDCPFCGCQNVVNERYEDIEHLKEIEEMEAYG